MSLARAILWLNAIGFIGFGAAFALSPQAMAALVDIALPTPTARIDFSATYGGFELGVGGFLVACARRRDWVEPGLWAGAAALAGFAVIRLLTLFTAGGATTPIYVALALEISGLALNLWGLRIIRRG